MFIKSLSIYEQVPDLKLIRKIDFRLGINCIVDETTEEGKGNGVGKTTALKVIDVCLGSKYRNLIYTDTLSQSKVLDLETYITEKKVMAMLVVGKHFDGPSEDCELKVELFEKGRRYINGESFTYNHYVQELKEIFFSDDGDKPTFRQLIPKFVRISLKDDSDKFLKFLAQSTDNEYQVIYNYLFRFSDGDVKKKYAEKERYSNQLDKYYREYKKKNSAHNVSEVEQDIDILKTLMDKEKEKLDVIVDAKEYLVKSNEISQSRLRNSQLAIEIDSYQFRRRKAATLLENIDKEVDIDPEVLSNLYVDARENFTIRKTFDELISFNQQLKDNKRKFYQKQLQDLDGALSDLLKKQNTLFGEYKDTLSLVNSNEVKEYYEVQAKISEYENKMGALSYVRDELRRLEEERAKVEEEISGLKEKIDLSENHDFKEKISKFNDLFLGNSQATCSEPCSINFFSEGFPLRLSSVTNGFGTGSRKSAVAAFDISYLQYAHFYGISVPDFIVHDVLETMDEKSFSAIVNIVENTDKCQYIIAVLNEKIKKYPFIKEEMIREHLSEKEKFFKI